MADQEIGLSLDQLEDMVGHIKYFQRKNIYIEGLTDEKPEDPAYVCGYEDADGRIWTATFDVLTDPVVTLTYRDV